MRVTPQRLDPTIGWEGRTFTEGSYYEARQGSGNTLEVTDDLGHTRVILLDVPCPHLVLRSAYRGYTSQNVVGKFVAVESTWIALVRCRAKDAFGAFDTDAYHEVKAADRAVAVERALEANRAAGNEPEYVKGCWPQREHTTPVSPYAEQDRHALEQQQLREDRFGG